MLNFFSVVEVKRVSVKNNDIVKLLFYVNYVENNIKKNYHNKTIGILIVKKKNRYVIEYMTSNDIYVTTYMLT